MATHNSYLAYKRDTRHLLYWVIHTSNSIISSLPGTESGTQNPLNTTGQTTVSGLLTMSELIAKYYKPIPSTIYRLFQSVIDARSAAYAIFQQVVPMNPDAEMEKSNASHKHFIDLVNRARALGMNEKSLLSMPSLLKALKNGNAVPPQDQLASMIPQGYRVASLDSVPNSTTPSKQPNSNGNNKSKDPTVSGQDLLTFLKYDIFKDVCGAVPLSGINYVWITIRFFITFTQIEEALRKVRNPLWVRAYETDQEWRNDKRVGLATLALFEEDEECLEIMAREFQNPRAGLMNHIYWEDLDETAQTIKGGFEDGGPPDCSVI